jgi:hypothetical protein
MATTKNKKVKEIIKRSMFGTSADHGIRLPARPPP